MSKGLVYRVVSGAVPWTLAALLAACGSDGGEAVLTSGTDVGGDAAVGETADDAAPADVAADTGSDATAEDTQVADTAADAAGEDAIVPADVPPADVPPPECTAAEKKACDDGLGCTTDTCTIEWGTAVCSWTLQKDTCFIAGVCRKAGEAQPGAACAQCLPSAATATWSPAPDGTACDDGDLCTWNGACKTAAGKQTCESQAVACDDKNPCTDDLCDKKVGCTYPLADGKPCDDGDACVKDDTCLGGKCLGKKVICDDNNPCTDDACDLAKGCTFTDNQIPCSDGDACTTGDVCAAGACVKGSKADCDDGNSCTLDVCNSGAGCYHLPLQSPCCTGQVSICDDQNPCTTDDCDPKTSGCSHSNNTVACEDGSQCTSGDACTGGKCAPGKDKVCNDNNPCTNDACSPTAGCVFSPTSGASCDDGNACTSGDVCAQGVCKGSGQCACTPTFSTQAQKVTSLLIGSGGKIGEGLDLDENPKTCAPTPSCSDGINNALGALAGVANTQLDAAVKSGSITFVFEFKDFKQGPINLALYTAKLDPANAGCDPQTASCIWQVDPKMLDSKCMAAVTLPGTLAGDQLLAGGKGTNFPFSLPVNGQDLKITIYGARLQGKVVFAGDKVVSMSGILAGSVPKASLLAAIDALPDGGSIPKDTLKGIVASLVQTDMDSDGDGTLDAASIGLKIQGIAGSISGVYP